MTSLQICVIKIEHVIFLPGWYPPCLRLRHDGARSFDTVSVWCWWRHADVVEEQHDESHWPSQCILSCPERTNASLSWWWASHASPWSKILGDGGLLHGWWTMRWYNFRHNLVHSRPPLDSKRHNYKYPLEYIMCNILTTLTHRGLNKIIHILQVTVTVYFATNRTKPCCPNRQPVIIVSSDVFAHN